MSVRPNWRDINVVDLTDEEVEQLTQQEQRWCLDLLCERARLKAEPAAEPVPVPTLDEAPVKFSRAQIDEAEIAIVDNGRRILVYPCEGANDDCFAGELLNPTEREMRGQGHISCLWDCSNVVALEGVKPLATPLNDGEGLS